MFSLSDQLISGITRTQDWEGLHLLGLVTLIHLHSSHTLGKKKLSEDAHHHDKGLLAEIWSNKTRQKTASGAYAGLGKMIFRHMSTHVIWSESRKDHVSLQYDDTAMTRIMWFLATTSRKSWTRTFFSINVLLFLSARMFLKREVCGFLWEASSFLNRGWQQRSPRTAAVALSFLDEVAGSSTKLRCDDTSLSFSCQLFLFSLSLFFVLFVKKRRLLPGRSKSSPTRGLRSSFSERTMKFPILIFQCQLLLVTAVQPVTVFQGRCTWQLYVVRAPFSRSTGKNITDRSRIGEHCAQLGEGSGCSSIAGHHSWVHCGTPIRSLGIARALVVVVIPPAFFLKGWKAFGDFIRLLGPEYLFFTRQTYSRTSPRTVLYFTPP